MRSQEPGSGLELEQNKLADEVSKRAASASEKIQKQVQENFIPNINEMGRNADRWLNGLENDFHILVEDPDDKCGGGNYKGWTADELRELYTVLFGAEMDE